MLLPYPFLKNRRLIFICVIAALCVSVAAIISLPTDDTRDIAEITDMTEDEDVYKPQNPAPDEIDLLKAKAAAGDPSSKHALSVLYRYGDGVEPDQEKFLSLLQEAADAGLPNARTDLGTILFYGEYMEQDYQKAAELFRLAANDEYPQAEYSLGVCYERGLGVEKDEAKAVKWYRKAAAQGDKAAAQNLINMNVDFK